MSTPFNLTRCLPSYNESILIGTRLILPGNMVTSESNGFIKVIIRLDEFNFMIRVISQGNVILVDTLYPSGTSMSMVVRLYISIFQLATNLF